MADLSRLLNATLPSASVIDGGSGNATATQGPNGGIFREVTDGSRYPYHVPSIFSVNMRNYGVNDTWSSSYQGSTYYTYMNGALGAEQTFWLGLGSNRQNGTTQTNYQMQTKNKIDWGTSNTNGGSDYVLTHTGWGYGPIITRMMFLRNHSTTARTTTVWCKGSAYWSAGYEGAGFAIGTPNVNGSYANTTGITWTVPYTTSSNNRALTISQSVTIQPKTTVAVIWNTNAYDYNYNSHNGNLYHWTYENKFYNMHGTWDGGANWIQPDLRMTWAANTFTNQNDWTPGGYSSHQVWNRAAALYGDR